MTISVKTHKTLWGRAANRCAMPECRRELVLDASGTDDETLIGEECHIVAREANGPRGTSELTEEQRDRYDNLILLCRVHHKKVDDQVTTHLADKLHQIKAAHEQWVRESLTSFDPIKQRDDEYYASVIDEWSSKAMLGDWQRISTFIVGPETIHVPRGFFECLGPLNHWLLSRVWPHRYECLERSFENFRHVVHDFWRTVEMHVDDERSDDDWVLVHLFHKVKYFGDSEYYDMLLGEYEFHINLLTDLFLEMTRAANYVCDFVRQYVDGHFRIQEGVLLAGGRRKPLRVEYRGDERSDAPYPGLVRFLADRFTRDVHYAGGLGERTPRRERLREYEAI